VQFIAFGHPLLKAIIQDCRSRTPKLRGATSAKHVSGPGLGAPCGILFNYLLRYSDAQDNTLSEELLPVFVTDHGKVVLDCGPELRGAKSEGVSRLPDDRQLQEIVADWERYETIGQEAAAKAAQKRFERVREKRDRQADASLHSLDASQKAKATRLNGALQNYQLRLFEGEEMDISIRRAQYELDQIESECDRRRQQIEARRQVQANAPCLLNVGILVTE